MKIAVAAWVAFWAVVAAVATLLRWSAAAPAWAAAWSDTALCLAGAGIMMGRVIGMPEFARRGRWQWHLPRAWRVVLGVVCVALIAWLSVRIIGGYLASLSTTMNELQTD